MIDVYLSVQVGWYSAFYISGQIPPPQPFSQPSRIMLDPPLFSLWIVMTIRAHLSLGRRTNADLEEGSHGEDIWEKQDATRRSKFQVRRGSWIRNWNCRNVWLGLRWRWIGQWILILATGNSSSRLFNLIIYILVCICDAFCMHADVRWFDAACKNFRPGYIVHCTKFVWFVCIWTITE